MALIRHYTRNEHGDFDCREYHGQPMAFVVEHIPDGVPFEIYAGEIGDDTRITDKFDQLRQPKPDTTYHIVESAGGGIGKAFSFVGKILNPVLKLLMPSQKVSTPGMANQQAESPNNSLTDRNNKPRPYQRTYDICGTVQSIPADLMTVFRMYSATGMLIEYGYYDVARGPVQTRVDGVTDGDTLLRDITGSSAAVFGPFTSPNSGAPQLVIGDPITEGLYITAAANEIDGQTLKAPNDLSTRLSNNTNALANGNVGVIRDYSGEAKYADVLKVGEVAALRGVYIPDVDPLKPSVLLDGSYTVLSIGDVDITLDISANVAQWAVVAGAETKIEPDKSSNIGPADLEEAGFTDWITISRIKSERVVVNISAENGMYKDDGKSGKTYATTTVAVQTQLVNAQGVPVGAVTETQGSLSGRSGDAIGVSVIVPLATPSAVRVRVRRVNWLDTSFQGQVVDEVKYTALYGQARDTSAHYGNRTTVHTARKQTPRATVVKQPQLKMVVTEMVYRYQGNGVFDTVLTPNTQAIQSLIRLMRDPVVGNQNLTVNNMDKLLAVQAEIEAYFGSPLAGQFCYTFDKYETTAQEIITTIAEAVFCSASRRGHEILLSLDKPRLGPEMVFTHRSKIPGSEKWTRNFNDKSAFDSLKFSYIDPDTNIKETITIPPTGGTKTDTFDSKGVRNRTQALWHAYRRYQRNLLNRVAVEFTATEEGIFATPGRPVSVVKGTRVAPYDGYVVAVNGMALTLSQPVKFTPGVAQHSVILKKRDGSVQSVAVTPGASNREVIMTAAPAEAIYTGNNALKTEFSFGDDARHNAHMVIVNTVQPGSDRTVRITGYNYSADYFKFDGVAPGTNGMIN